MSARWSERDRDRFHDRDRDHSEGPYYRGRRPASPPRDRDHSADRFPPGGPPRGRAFDDDFIRDPRYHHDDRYDAPQPQPMRDDHDHRRGPPVMEREMEKEMGFEKYRRDRAPARPNVLRRPSSVDSLQLFAREREREEYRPVARREDYRPGPVPTPPPATIPRTRQLPPPERRTYNDMPYYDEIKIAEPDRYGDEEFHNYPEERLREREYVRSRHRSRSRSRSRDSYATATTVTTRRGRTRRSDSPSRSSRVSSRSSSTSSDSTAVRSEYPKRGKTKIPARLVSIRALIDLGYPFVEQANTIIVQKALGQDNIDELLRLSDEYKKSDPDHIHGRSSAPNLVEDRRPEFYAVPPPHSPADALSPVPVQKLPPPPSWPQPPATAPPMAPHTHPHQPPPTYAPGPPPTAPPVSFAPYHPPPVTAPPMVVDISPPSHHVTSPSGPLVRRTEEYIHEHHYPSSYHEPSHHHHHSRSYSPTFHDHSPPHSATSFSTSSHSSYSPSIGSSHHAHFTSPTSGPMVLRDVRTFEVDEYSTSGSVALAPPSPRRHRSHSRSHSRSHRNIRREIKALEAELRDGTHGSSSELVRAERLPDGAIVLHEEKVEKIRDGYKGARIERDKKGRMTISLPKYR